MRGEVVVGGQHAGTDEFLLEDVDKGEQVLGVVVADVIQSVGCLGQSVGPGGALRRALHDADDALDDVVDISEVALAVAVVEDADGIALHQFVGEPEVGHVRSAGWTVDGEEAEARAGDVVQLAVGMSHEFVALLRGGIETHGVINLVVGGIRYLGVGAVDAR